MTPAQTIVGLLEAYAVFGAVVAAVFLSVGIGRVDPGARGSFLFRLLMIPGMIGLWPLVLWRWGYLEGRRRNGYDHH